MKELLMPENEDRQELMFDMCYIENYIIYNSRKDWFVVDSEQ